MCEPAVKHQIQLVAHRRKAYEEEAIIWSPTDSPTWKPEDTEAALKLFDFQDFLEAGAKYWNHLCRSRDWILSHEGLCDHDHSSDFDQLDEAIANFAKNATAIIENVLPYFESQYDDVENADALRIALKEAEIFIVPLNDPAPTRTPIAEWIE